MIRAMMQRQGNLGIERMCVLAPVGRAGYYRQWQASAPRQEATELRNEIQLLALAHRHYGHRRITVLLQRSGWSVNKKRVLRLMREDNLLCVAAKFRAGDDGLPAWLAGVSQSGPAHDSAGDEPVMGR